MSLSCPKPMEPSESHSERLEIRIICVFRLNSAATGSLTYEQGDHTKTHKDTQIIIIIIIQTSQARLTVWGTR